LTDFQSQLIQEGQFRKHFLMKIFSIDEENQSRFPENRKSTIVEIHKSMPSITIVRGQNWSEISHKTSESCDCGVVIQIESHSFHGHRWFG
jgi:hypothetical protein